MFHSHESCFYGRAIFYVVVYRSFYFKRASVCVFFFWIVFMTNFELFREFRESLYVVWDSILVAEASLAERARRFNK